MLSGAAMHKMSFEVSHGERVTGRPKPNIWPILMLAGAVISLTCALAPMALAWLRQ